MVPFELLLPNQATRDERQILLGLAKAVPATIQGDYESAGVAVAAAIASQVPNDRPGLRTLAEAFLRGAVALAMTTQRADVTVEAGAAASVAIDWDGDGAPG